MFVGGLVFGFNGSGQRLNGAEMQRRHLLHVDPLRFEAVQINPVRTVHKVHDGQREERGLPTEGRCDRVEKADQYSTREIIRKRPEKFAQGGKQRLALGESDHDRNHWQVQRKQRRGRKRNPG